MFTWIKTHRWLSILISILVVGSGAFYYFRRPQVEYDTYTVSRANLSETLELSGKIVSANSATLRFSAGGLVTYLGAQEGDSVKKWQTLASIDTRQLQKTLEQKLNLYSIQRGIFDQTIDDNDNSVPAGDDERKLKRLLEKNQFQLENTIKDVEYQDLALKLSRISSPISGILVSSPITTSNVIVLATDTWVVVDPTSLYFSSDVDETDLSKVKVGQKVEVTLDAFANQTYPATITSIGYSPKETTTGTTYEVKIKLTNTDLTQLRLGLNGTGSVVLNEKIGVLTLSSSALSGQNKTTQVTVKNGNHYETKNITLGIENNGVVEITSGLSEGDIVYVQK